MREKEVGSRTTPRGAFGFLLTQTVPELLGRRYDLVEMLLGDCAELVKGTNRYDQAPSMSAARSRRR